MDRQPPDKVRRPPVQFDHIVQAAPDKPVAQPQRHQKARRAASPGRAAGARCNHPDGRSGCARSAPDRSAAIAQRKSWRAVATRTGKGHRRGPLAEHRIGEHVHPARLQQHGGMADPVTVVCSRLRCKIDLRLGTRQTVAAFRLPWVALLRRASQRQRKPTPAGLWVR